jgi:quercetin dioxygenase-like cupin family protein
MSDFQRKWQRSRDFYFAGFLGNLEISAQRNEREGKTHVFSTDNMQLYLVVLPIGGSLPAETHAVATQFVILKEGAVKVTIGDNSLVMTKQGDAAVVPPGKVHELLNVGPGEAKMWTIYSGKGKPPENQYSPAYDSTGEIASFRARSDSDGDALF